MVLTDHVLLADKPCLLQEPAAAAAPALQLEAEPQPLSEDERMAQHAAAVAAATAVLSEASASALKDVIAEEGISEEEQAESIAAAREQRMQQLLYAITVLASSSGAPHVKLLAEVSASTGVAVAFGLTRGGVRRQKLIVNLHLRGLLGVLLRLAKACRCCAVLRCAALPVRRRCHRAGSVHGPGAAAGQPAAGNARHGLAHTHLQWGQPAGGAAGGAQ